MADLCRKGAGFFYFGTATPGQIAGLVRAVQPVYDRYLATAPTGQFMRAIQRIKDHTPPPPAPRPYPTGCASERGRGIITRAPSSTVTSTWSPGFTAPVSISMASGSCTRFWMTRLSGRAP